MAKKEIRQSTLAKMSNEQLRSSGYIRIPAFTRKDGTKVKAHIRELKPSEKPESSDGDSSWFGSLSTFSKRISEAVDEAVDAVEKEVKTLNKELADKVAEVRKDVNNLMREAGGAKLVGAAKSLYSSQGAEVYDDFTGTGLHSSARHQSASAALSDYISKPFHDAGIGIIGDIIGDTVSFIAGAVREIPALQQSIPGLQRQPWSTEKKFNSEYALANLNGIVADIVDNYKGSFGTKYQTDAKDIYRKVFTEAKNVHPEKLRKMNDSELRSFGYFRGNKQHKAMSEKSLNKLGYIRIPSYTRRDGTKVEGYTKKIFK